MTPDEPDLIARGMAGGDPNAFGELVRLHQSPVRRFLRHLTGGNEALADDLAQETFIRAYRGLSGFRARSRFQTWLLGIAYNQYRNAARRGRREVPASEAGPVPAPATEALSDLEQDLAISLRELSNEEQLALRLSFQFELTHDEIAATLGWPLGTVKTQIARGKSRLRELMSAWRPRP
ncbi:MAG TPA: sigma-70 family RNA polymerase sigma factor [Opitutaceae bacterium]